MAIFEGGGSLLFPPCLFYAKFSTDRQTYVPNSNVSKFTKLDIALYITLGFQQILYSEYFENCLVS